MNKMSYKEKFVQMNKEAKATWIVAAVIIIFWWVAGFGVYSAFGAGFTMFGMPAWFVLSCFGSWILSIVLVDDDVSAAKGSEKGEDVNE